LSFDLIFGFFKRFLG